MNLLQTILEPVENSNHAGSRQDLHGFLNVAEMLPGVQAAEQQIQVAGIDSQNSNTDKQRPSGEEKELEAFPDPFFTFSG